MSTTIITGYLGVNGLDLTNYSGYAFQVLGRGLISDTTRALNGAVQTENFRVLGSESGVDNNLAHFDNDKNTSRATITVSNSASYWSNNFVQTMVHGSNYATDNYLGVSNAGLAMVLGQGSEITKFAIGMYNAAPVSLFTNNTERLIIDSAGSVQIPGSLTVNGESVVLPSQTGQFVANSFYRAGTVSVTGLSTSKTINFSSPFSNSGYSITAVPSSSVCVYITNKTLSGFKINLATGISGGTTINYIALADH